MWKLLQTIKCKTVNFEEKMFDILLTQSIVICVKGLLPSFTCSLLWKWILTYKYDLAKSSGNLKCTISKGGLQTLIYRTNEKKKVEKRITNHFKKEQMLFLKLFCT